MKLTITALLLSATAALAGPTENITGCATAPAEGSNFTVRLDPHCALSSDRNDGSTVLDNLSYAMWVDIVTPDEEAE